MSEIADTIDVTLPSGKVATLRNYTTHADDEKYEQVLYAGVNADADTAGDAKIKFPLLSVITAERAYIPRLLLSLDGDSQSIALRVQDLRSSDYEALESAVSKIVEENSPKAKAVKESTATA